MRPEIIDEIKRRYMEIETTIDITGRPAREVLEYVAKLEAELAEARGALESINRMCGEDFDEASPYANIEDTVRRALQKLKKKEVQP